MMKCPYAGRFFVEEGFDSVGAGEDADAWMEPFSFRPANAACSRLVLRTQARRKEKGRPYG
jgi:hypothetical protein